MKIPINIFLIISLSILIISCKNASDRLSQQDDSELENISQQAFLIGNGPNSKKTIKDMIEKSGIRKGGYVVILPMKQNKQDSSAWFLQQEFYDQQIIAVHILYLLSDSSLKNTDVLAIENAGIICLIDGNRNKFIKLAESTRLKVALQNAYIKGALITGIAKGASVLGEYYYNQVKDTISNNKKVKFKPGLGLLKNTVIDDIGFFRNYQDGIQKNSAKKKFMFIGLGYKSAVWIKNENAVVLRKSEVGLISPEKAISKIGKGDEFELLKQ